MSEIKCREHGWAGPGACPQCCSTGRVQLLHYGEPSEALCPFEHYDDRRPDVLRAHVQRPFRPVGLMLWDLPHGALVWPIVGSGLELVVAFGAVPARWFASCESFEAVAKMLDQGKQPPSWGRWNVVTPGQFIELRFTLSDGKPVNVFQSQALMWGHEARP